MKKIIVLLLLICLCGCQKSNDKILEELGYTPEDIEMIMGFNEDTQGLFLDAYHDDYVKLIHMENFREGKLDKYITYYGQLDDRLMIKFVNEGIINSNNASKLGELYENDFFIEKYERLYLRYIDEYESARETIEYVNTKRYMPMYSEIEIADLSKNYLVLVNKYHQLPADYEPDDLVDIDPSYGKGSLREEVYEAYRELYREAREKGYDLQVVSAYRSYDYQDGLYKKYLRSDTQQNVDTYSARPGHSEHQSGLCLDVSIPGYSLDDFYLTDASKWLNENCVKYGFIIRYTQDKVDITGYQAEPWQIRYVGKDAAKQISELGITFDEYYACYVE